MNPILFGLVAGTSFGLVAVGSMLPMQFQDKPVALAAVFCSRFAITKAYAPILRLGITGGAVTGWQAGRYVA